MSKQSKESVIRAIADLPHMEFEHKFGNKLFKSVKPKKSIEEVNAEFEELLKSDFVQKYNSTPEECEDDAIGIMRARYPWVTWSKVGCEQGD